MLDVVVPTNNDDIRLCLTLWGLTQQSYKSFNVYVVNDGGSDKTFNIINQFKNLLNIEYIYLNPSDIKYRPSLARNAGIKASTNDRILFIDCDTIPCINVVEEHHKHIDNTDIVVGPRKYIEENDVKWLYYKYKNNMLTYDNILNLHHVDDERICVSKYSSQFLSLEFKYFDTYPYAHTVTNYKLCHSCQISYNTKIVKSLGGFNEAYDGIRFGEDHDLAIRAIRYGCSILTIPNVYVYHLGHQPRAIEDSDKIANLISKTRTSHNLVNISPIS